MTTYEIYLEMQEQGLTTSMREFSTNWLGRAQNFCVSRQSQPLPAEDSIGLRWRLFVRGHYELANMVLDAVLTDYIPIND
jgi:hypothetical protein